MCSDPQLDLLLAHLAAIGLTVTEGNQPGELLLNGPASEKTPAILAQLKMFKPQLLARFAAREPTPQPDPEDESTETCSLCGLTVIPEIKPRLADALWCSRGGAKATSEHPAEPRCPYKPLSRGTN